MVDLCIINVYAMGKNEMDKKFLLIGEVPCAAFGKCGAWILFCMQV